MSPLRLFLCLCVILTIRAGGATALDPVLSLDGAWTMKAGDFQSAVAAHQLPFRWNSAAQDSARASGKELTLLGLPLVEMLARFEAGKLAQLSAVLYARGDVGELAKEDFEALLR